MPLTSDERQQFFAQPHIAALSVSAGSGRGPLTVPIWYQYRPGGEVWVLTGPQSQKMRLIREAGRFTLMVEQVEPTVRYVSVEGPVIRVAPATDEMHREMVARYLPAESVDAYLKAAEAYGEQVAIYLRPEHWLSADLGNLSEL
ncbi:pyridoxamine 5'-phosphate oxidase family protein [Nocardia sp. NPDC049220]|uniref:pyridoxamine 5'-phosphate oxidase family protein n=1 Tax=Nocardia sp. NPDC049220 TaxID=3155273 RepID=UPI0033CB2374